MLLNSKILYNIKIFDIIYILLKVTKKLIIYWYMNFLIPQICHSPEWPSWWTTFTISTTAKEINEALRHGAKFLKPLHKNRKFSISGDNIYVPTHGNTSRKIDIATDDERSGVTTIKNSLTRELVILIKWEKDEIVAQDQNVKRLARLLLRVAWNSDNRKFLNDFAQWFSDDISAVSWIWKDYDIKREGTMKTLYEKLITRLEFSTEDIDVILAFSWEWKSTFRHATYGCRMWMIITCIVNMIDLDKEDIAFK